MGHVPAGASTRRVNWPVHVEWSPDSVRCDRSCVGIVLRGYSNGNVRRHEVCEEDVALTNEHSTCKCLQDADQKQNTKHRLESRSSGLLGQGEVNALLRGRWTGQGVPAHFPDYASGWHRV
jgi:hypothetical protein